MKITITTSFITSPIKNEKILPTPLKINRIELNSSNNPTITITISTNFSPMIDWLKACKTKPIKQFCKEVVINFHYSNKNMKPLFSKKIKRYPIFSKWCF